MSALRMLLLALTLGATAPAVLAHGDTAQASAKADAPLSTEVHTFGKQGAAQNVTRTITIVMSDAMRFSPGDIKVRQGETIRFIVRNKGKVLHEMVIGTMEELKSHGELMKQHPGMEHDEAYMAHVGAGKKGQMVWQFTEPGAFYFACLLPGHLEAGMVGKITVTKG